MNPFRQLWQLSLFSFIMAAITGFLYRYGMLYPMPELFYFVNIRHAHSHLMFFNWVCPPLMILMIQHLSKNGKIDGLKSLKWCSSGTFNQFPRGVGCFHISIYYYRKHVGILGHDSLFSVGVYRRKDDSRSLGSDLG